MIAAGSQPPVAEPEGAEPAPAESAPAASASASAPAAVADEDGLEEPVLVVPRGLVWVTLAALTLTAALSVVYAPAALPSSEASLELHFWPGQPWELAEMRARIDALVKRYPPLGAEEDALRGELTQWLAREAELGALAAEHDLAARQLLATAEERVRKLVLARGQDALQAIAARYALEVRTLLETTLAQLPQAQRNLNHLAGDPRGQALHTLAPGLLSALGGTGIERLMVGKTLAPAGQLVVEALATQRMLDLGARLPDRPALPTDVQALLLRWRVEAHEGLPAERRAQLLHQLAAMDPGYPADFTAGVIAARADDCATAVKAWQRAAARRQETARAKANLRWCNKRLQELR